MADYLLIDGNNMAHRAHNVNFELKTTLNQPSGMFYGLIRMLTALKKNRYMGAEVIVVWDGNPRAKYELQPDYKSGRRPLSSTIWCQVADIREYLSNIGVTQYRVKDQEADDVIATLAHRFSSEGSRVYIYSNDKDLLQLVCDGKIIVHRPKVGHTPERFFDEEAVRKLFGVPPSRLACYRSFDGDSSDSIKGVPRVPRKIIAKAVNEHGDVEVIYEKLSEMELTDFQLRSFREAHTRVANNIKLIRLNTGIEKLSPIEADPNADRAQEFLDKYEIRSVKLDDIIELFSTTVDIRYADPQPAHKLEPYSLF